MTDRLPEGLVHGQIFNTVAGSFLRLLVGAYTGNHYLSKGYHIHAAVSEHPLGPYRDVTDNPVVVRTQGGVVGLGHSSTVLGPNLLSHYMAYHNLNPDWTRDLNIDEVVFEPEGMVVLGQTCGAHPVPAMPDFSCRGESGSGTGLWPLQKAGADSADDGW